MHKPSLPLPLALIIIGGLLFLNIHDILPLSSIVISAGLVIAGLLVLILDGINKQSVVSAPFLMYCGVAVYLHYVKHFRLYELIAVGMMVVGLFMLIARSKLISNRID